jgi:hypothetical protein
MLVRAHYGTAGTPPLFRQRGLWEWRAPYHTNRHLHRYLVHVIDRTLY